MRAFTDHPTEASRFVSDGERAHWHDRALWFVRAKRDRASETLPEWERLREEAHRIKSHTMKHLAWYLRLFEERATANGIEVRWASDALEHNEIVASILREEGVERVVKSKSMLTEECGLNPYLQERGIEVVDTDLGERIVQLAGDTPSHIVLPAIHLKKEDVSEIFAEHMGTEEGNSDPVYLTVSARKSLREKFLTADAAITGVNFALAREGAVTICTNEGNADLGVAVTKLHIASMGIEKIIPSAQSLGVFTRLLARSATGQAVTTYTSHYSAPEEGARMVVVIVDNGRSGLLAGEESPILSCIRCGSCMNTCPVYRRSGGHSYGSVVPGPIGTLLAYSRDGERYSSLPFACTLCASCTMVCPAKVPLHDTIYRVRKSAIETPTYTGKRKALSLIYALLRYRPLYLTAMTLYGWAVKYLPRNLLYSGYNVWGRDRDMPEPARRSFSRIYDDIERREDG